MKFHHHCSWNLSKSEWFPAVEVGARMPYQTENISSSIRTFDFIQWDSVQLWSMNTLSLFSISRYKSGWCMFQKCRTLSINPEVFWHWEGSSAFAPCVFLCFTSHESGQRMQPDCRGDILLVHRAADNKKGNTALHWAYVDFFPVLYCWFSFTEWWLSLCFQKARIILELFGFCISSVQICMHG